MLFRFALKNRNLHFIKSHRGFLWQIHTMLFVSFATQVRDLKERHVSKQHFKG